MIVLNYTDFKTATSDRSMPMQYVAKSDYGYDLYAFDDEMHFKCILEGSAEITDFETNYKASANVPIHSNKVTPDQGALKVSTYAPEGSSATKVSHDWTDKTTWQGSSIEISAEVMTTGDDLTFSSANDNWIDLTHGKLYDEYNLVDKKEPVIYVDDVETTTGFTIDFSLGEVVFDSSQSGKTIKCDYWHADKSDYILAPDTGKIMLIEHAELQFSKDIDVTTAINFEVWGYNPADLPNKMLYQRIKYKNIKDIINAANLGQGFIPAVGGLTNDILVFPFNYATVKPFKSSLGLELRVNTDNDDALGGEWGTATFYILSQDE